MTGLYHAAIFEPLPGTRRLDGIDLNPDITVLQYSTGVGGFNGLNVGLRDAGTDPRFGGLPVEAPVSVAGFCRVLLEQSGVTIWEGRVSSVQDVGSITRSFTAQGYGLAAMNDDCYTITGGAALTSGPLLAAVLASTAPLIKLPQSLDEFVDSGVSHLLTEFAGLAPSQVVSRLQQEGGGAVADSQNAPWDWAVWERQVCSWQPRIAPTGWPELASDARGARYRIDNDATVTRTKDFSSAVSAVTIAYNAGAEQTVTSTSFVDTYGFTRRVRISGGQLSDAQAIQTARTYLALHEHPDVSYQITRDRWTGLRLANGGAEQPPEMVRFGDWVQIGDDPPAMILTTQMDCNTGSFSATASVYPRGYFLSLDSLRQSMGRVALALNPTTGAPA